MNSQKYDFCIRMGTLDTPEGYLNRYLTVKTSSMAARCINNLLKFKNGEQ